MKTDKLFYEAFLEFPEIFFELIGAKNVDARAYEFKAIELKETASRLDGAMLPLNKDPKQPIYFIEVQGYKNPKIYANVLKKVGMYLEQNDPTQDWCAVVVYERRSFAPEETTPYRGIINSGQLLRIYLDEMEPADPQTKEIGIIKLIVDRAKNAKNRAKALIKQVRSESTDGDRTKKMVDLIVTIMSYKFADSSREELEAMLGLEDFKKTRLGQEMLAEGRQEGRQEGEEVGIAKGRQAIRIISEGFGSLEGQLKLVPVLLQLGFTFEEVADLLKVETEQVRQLAEPEQPEQSL
ncbi:MAG: Rpn family recombination-promoting nuclease/putative transposase [Hormoscilla sp.]